jgi:hypothetical protein
MPDCLHTLPTTTMLHFVAADNYFAIYTETKRTGQIGPDGQPVLRSVVGWGTVQCSECEKLTTAAYVVYPYENRLVRADELEGFVCLIGPNPQPDHKVGAVRLVTEQRVVLPKLPISTTEKRYLRVQARPAEANNEE